MESKVCFFSWFTYIYQYIFINDFMWLLAMIHTFSWIPRGVMGGKTISFGGGNQTLYPGRFSGEKAPETWSLNEFLRVGEKSWRNNISLLLLFPYYSSLVINPTVRVYIPIIGGWWQLKDFFKFSPRNLGKMNPIWRAYFFEWVGSTTN